MNFVVNYCKLYSYCKITSVLSRAVQDFPITQISFTQRILSLQLQFRSNFISIFTNKFTWTAVFKIRLVVCVRQT